MHEIILIILITEVCGLSYEKNNYQNKLRETESQENERQDTTKKYFDFIKAELMTLKFSYINTWNPQFKLRFIQCIN